MDSKNNFRLYLENTGAITAITDVFVQMLELDEKPLHSVEFIRRNIGEPNITELENDKLKIELEEISKYLQNLKLRQENGECEDIDLTDSERREKILFCYQRTKDDPEYKSMLTKYFPEIIAGKNMELKSDTFHSDIFDCIKSGLILESDELTVYAADAECYDIFSHIFHQIISDVHFELSDDFQHPAEDWGDANEINNPDNEFFKILKCQMNCTRSLDGFPFFPKMTERQFVDVFNVIRVSFDNEKFQGKFYNFEHIDEILQIKSANYMFDEGDAVLKASGCNKYWPKGRGIFVSEDRKFVAQINCKDHLRFGCAENGNDIKSVFLQLSEYNKIFKEQLQFIKHEKFGFLNSSPRLIGNAIEIGFLLSFAEPIELDTVRGILTQNDLRITNSRSEGGNLLVEIRNNECLGLTEIETIKKCIEGLNNVNLNI